jgi:branched-chain amino acid transport system permease protein
MSLRAQFESWQRQLVASRAAGAIAEGMRRSRELGNRAGRQLRSLARAARAQASRWTKQLTSLARHLGQRATCALVWTRDRLIAWRRQARANPTVTSVIARMKGWWRHAEAGFDALRHTSRRWVARTAAAAGDTRRRLAQTAVAQGAVAEVARTAAWLRTGPLGPFTTRVDNWLAGRRKIVGGQYRIEVATPRSRTFAIAGTGLMALLVALPAFAGRNLINELIFVFTMLALSQYWNLLAGYAGLVSVGQQAFVGLGGYLLFALSVHAGMDPLMAMVLAGAIAAVLAIPTALVVFRLRGAYFAIGTWVVAEVYRLVFAQFRQLGGGTGTSLPPFITNEVVGIGWVKETLGVSTGAARDIITYWTALALAAGTVLLVYLILRSRYGLALAAIRDSERAAESVGVDNFKTKLKVYIVAAAGTGMVGALIYLQKARISPDAAFSVLDWTANVIFIVVIGGIGTIEGPIVGVLVFYFLQTNFAHRATWYLILLGLFAIVTMLFAPKGIWGYLSGRYGLVIFPIRRRLVANTPSSPQGDVAKTTSEPAG